jgi:hypothetical protein
MLNMRSIEGKAVVGNDDAKNIKKKHVISQMPYYYRILVNPVC